MRRIFVLLALVAAAGAEEATPPADLAVTAWDAEVRAAGEKETTWLLLDAPEDGIVVVRGLAAGVPKDCVRVPAGGGTVETAPARWDGQDRVWAFRVRKGPSCFRLAPGGKPTVARCSFGKDDPWEPDDDPARARKAAPGEPFPVRIVPGGETDAVAVEAAAPGYLVVTEIEGKDRPQAAIRDAKALLGDTAKGLGWAWRGNDWWTAVRVVPGPFVVTFAHATPMAEAATFRIDLVPEDDDYEPNDTMDFARTAALLMDHRLRFLPKGDVDWLRIRIPAEGVLVLRQRGAAKASARVAFALFPPGGGETPLPGLSWDRDDLWTALRVAPGDYLVRASGEMTAEPVTVAFEFDVETDPFEPDDDPASAPLLEEQWTGRFFPPGDVDCRTIDLEAPAMLSLQIGSGDGPARAKAELLLEGGGGPVPVPMVARGSAHGGAFELPKGRHVLRLSADASMAPVRCSAYLYPALDPFEPNDAAAEARPLPLDENLQLPVNAGNDDWFRIDVPAPSILVADFSSGSEEIHHLLVHGFVSDAPDAAPVFEWGFGGNALGGRAARVPAGTLLLRFAEKKSPLYWVFVRLSLVPLDGAPDSGLFVVGLGTGPQEKDVLDGIARAGGGGVFGAEDNAKIAEVLVEVARKGEEAREERKRRAEEEDRKAAAAPEDGETPWLLIVVGLLAVAAAFATVVLRRA